MAQTRASAAMRRFVDDELLRAPMLFDMVVDGTVAAAQGAFPRMSGYERGEAVELIEALRKHRHRMGQQFVEALRDAVDPTAPIAGGGRLTAGMLTLDEATPAMLSLVDDDAISLDVQLSHAIQAVKGIAETELRELESYCSALAGDMEMSAEHNPFGPETMARALWAASQLLSSKRGQQVAFLHFAGDSLAQVLKRSYGAAATRLASMGIEPAAYRTLVLTSGTRRGIGGSSAEGGWVPDLHRMLDSMPVPLDGHAPPAAPPTARPAAAPPPHRPGDPPLGVSGADTPRRPTTGQVGTAPEPGPPGQSLRQSELATLMRQATSRVDRQAIELISRLFDALAEEPRMPVDVKMLISRLHAPAMRLTLRDNSVLDPDRHALWAFVNRFAYHAEMMPDPADPERLRYLRTASQLIDQIAAAVPSSAPYDKALALLDAFLHQKLARRCTSASSQIGALQKLEDKLMRDASAATLSTLSGIDSHPLDARHLDTVPAELMERMAPARKPVDAAREWLDELAPGTWVRLFLQGRWVQVQLLWPGERRLVWLFGDGASDATFAVQRSALLTLHAEGLAKTLIVRSMVAAAARRVQRQVEDGG
jgi:hypothetical protein